MKLGFISLLTVALITLKLMGVAEVSWLTIGLLFFSPIILTATIIIILIVLLSILRGFRC